MAKLLLEAGADVETPDNYGQSPFFMACWKGHADVAALLLEYDANKDCRTKTGITPLFQVSELQEWEGHYVAGMCAEVRAVAVVVGVGGSFCHLSVLLWL